MRCLTENGHQTSIVTTRTGLTVVKVAERMFSHRRQVNFEGQCNSTEQSSAVAAWCSWVNRPIRR